MGRLIYCAARHLPLKGKAYLLRYAPPSPKGEGFWVDGLGYEAEEDRLERIAHKPTLSHQVRTRDL